MGDEAQALFNTFLTISAASVLGLVLTHLLPTPWLPRKTGVLLIYTLPVAFWTGLLAPALLWSIGALLMPIIMGGVAFFCFRLVYVVDRDMGSMNNLPFAQACIAASYAVCTLVIWTINA